MNSENIHAAFVLAPCGDGLYAATTRPGGGIGLPGGKLEEGETPREAAVRESAEEGWHVSGIDKEPFIIQLIDGNRIAWFKAKAALRLDRFKEQGRIVPIEANKKEVVASGWGNENIFPEKSPEEVTREAEEQDRLMARTDVLETRIEKLNEQIVFLSKDLAICDSELSEERNKASHYKRKADKLEGEVKSLDFKKALLEWESNKLFEKNQRLEGEIASLKNSKD